jgi:hypothetical protein
MDVENGKKDSIVALLSLDSKDVEIEGEMPLLWIAWREWKTKTNQDG